MSGSFGHLIAWYITQRALLRVMMLQLQHEVSSSRLTMFPRIGGGASVCRLWNVIARLWRKTNEDVQCWLPVIYYDVPLESFAVLRGFSVLQHGKMQKIGTGSLTIPHLHTGAAADIRLDDSKRLCECFKKRPGSVACGSFQDVHTSQNWYPRQGGLKRKFT